MSDKQAIVELLNADLRDEHAAIVQYLQHAYAIGEGEEAGEIEAIAREEMRHLDWLAEAIVERTESTSLPQDSPGVRNHSWCGIPSAVGSGGRGQAGTGNRQDGDTDARARQHRRPGADASE